MRKEREEKRWIRSTSLAVVLMATLILMLWLEMPAEVLAAETSELNRESTATELLYGKTAGVMTGTPQDQIVQAVVPDAEIQYYNNMSDMCLALESGKIDFYVLSTVNYYSLAEEYPDIGYLDISLTTFDVGTIFPMTEDGEALREELNEYIAEITKSGELEELQNYWLMPQENWETVDIPQTGENGVLTFATINTLMPFSFMDGDRNVGFDVAIIAGFCREYGYGLSIENVDFSGVLSGISTGKYDLAAGQISWTEERAQSVLYSDFYYTQKVVPIVLSKDYDSDLLVTANSAKVQNGADGKTFWTSFRRTLIDENRWKMILHGFLVTVEITLGGFVLANILGIMFCAMSMSGNRILKSIAEIYSRLMQGLPIVVVLMLLYYIVFGYSKISNDLVSIIGFGMVFGTYMAQLFERGICSVDKGQMEAALAIGFTKRRAFAGIVLPQAIGSMLPGYFSNLISLMKGTAIVGYIAVYDLTKAGDIIRSSTYEAFAPLLAVAVIYFAAACLLLGVMNLLQKKLLAKRPHRFYPARKKNR